MMLNKSDSVRSLQVIIEFHGNYEIEPYREIWMS